MWDQWEKGSCDCCLSSVSFDTMSENRMWLTWIESAHETMILEIITNTWKLNGKRYAKWPQQWCWSYPRQLQDLCGMQCATGNDDFSQRMNGLARRRGTFRELENSAGYLLFGFWREKLTYFNSHDPQSWRGGISSSSISFALYRRSTSRTKAQAFWGSGRVSITILFAGRSWLTNPVTTGNIVY